jgi:hypothetical protein
MTSLVAFDSMVDSTVGHSFAIWAPRRKNCHHPPSCLRTACYVDPCNDGCGCGNSTSSSSEASSRSVTFAEDVVSEVRSVPKYEKESLALLFYNGSDLQRFRHEVKLESMRVQVIW